MDDVKVIVTSTKSVYNLMTFESLYIRAIKPTINTKDEYKSRTLVIKIQRATSSILLEFDFCQLVYFFSVFASLLFILVCTFVNDEMCVYVFKKQYYCFLLFYFLDLMKYIVKINITLLNLPCWIDI